MHIQFNFQLVQQCIKISTRINSTNVHTYILRLFYIVSSSRMFILINPIFNSNNRDSTSSEEDPINTSEEVEAQEQINLFLSNVRESFPISDQINEPLPSTS